MPMIEDSADLITINRFELGNKSNTFGGTSPEAKENSFNYRHMRSGSFGCGFEASAHSSSVVIANDKDFGFIEDEIERFNKELTTKEPFAVLIQNIKDSENKLNSE